MTKGQLVYSKSRKIYGVYIKKVKQSNTKYLINFKPTDDFEQAELTAEEIDITDLIIYRY